MPTVPSGRVPAPMARGAGLMVRVTGPVVLWAGLPLSVAFTIKFTVPAMVGVPLTRQLGPSVRPAWSVPEMMVQEYGEEPPATPIVELYGVPTVPAGSDPVVRLSPAGLIVSDTGPVVVCTGLLLSVAFTVRLAVPGVVGVPLMRQPAPSDRPAGRVPAVTVQTYGDVPPVTPMVAE